MNNFKQPTQMAHCKDCHKEFESKLVFGSWVKRCDECKTPFKDAAWIAAQLKARMKEESHKPCGHSNLNAGGYCNICGNGRDFS